MDYKIKTPDNQFVGKGFDEVVTAAELEGWDVEHLVKIGSLEPVAAVKKEAK